jgi:hypothetical protein
MHRLATSWRWLAAILVILRLRLGWTEIIITYEFKRRKRNQRERDKYMRILFAR